MKPQSRRNRPLSARPAWPLPDEEAPARPSPDERHLHEHRAAAEAAFARLDQVPRRSEAVDAGPVFRAMNNLKMAPSQKLSDAPDKALLFAVADAMCDAARTIERL